MKIKTCPGTIIFMMMLFPVLYGYSQTSKQFTNDAQIWENINADWKFARNFTAKFSHEGRFTNNDSRLTYYFEDEGLEYKFPRSHFSLTLDYVFIRKRTQQLQTQYWDNRHQYYLAAMWSKKFGQFELHDRQMLMGQVKDVLSSDAGKIPDWYLRNKVTVKYSFNFYWSVYVADELYYHMITPQPDALPHINRMRYFIGGYYRPDKRSEFELYYLIEQHMNVVNANHNFILGLGYSLSL
ncbi:MAG TPA: DUF2490 domain-containing protein [Bacteroidia bacterium]|nr:DUF2490 domain-containing protein [Bacteroidia bacterium]